MGRTGALNLPLWSAASEGSWLTVVDDAHVALSAACHARHSDFHVLAERIQEPEETGGRETPERTSQQIGHVGLTDSEELCGFGLSEFTAFHDGGNAHDHFRLEEKRPAVRESEVFEDVSTASLDTNDGLCLRLAHSIRSRSHIPSRLA